MGVKCEPFHYCERQARHLGGCVAGECNPPAVAQLRVFDLPGDGDAVMARHHVAEALLGGAELVPGVYRLVLHPGDAPGVQEVPRG